MCECVRVCGSYGELCICVCVCVCVPVFVDESVESHPVSPAGGEVVDVDIWISGQEEEITAHQLLMND